MRGGGQNLKHFCWKINSGSNISPHSLKDREKFTNNPNVDNISFLIMSDINNYGKFKLSNTFSRFSSKNYINKEFISEKIFSKNAIIIGSSGQGSLKNHRCIWMSEKKFMASSVLTVIQVNERLIHPYLVFYQLLNLKTEDIAWDRGYPGIKTENIENIKIQRYSVNKEDEIISKISKILQLEKKLFKLRSELSTELYHLD